jgi:hypothetical protein
MKTTSSIVKRRRQSFTRLASVVAIILPVAVLAFSQPVFAQTYGGFAPAGSIEHYEIPMTSDLDDPWDDTQPSHADPALAPAPKESVEPPLAPTHVPFMPGVDGHYVEPWNDPAMPYTQPMVVSRPNSMGMPGSDFRIRFVEVPRQRAPHRRVSGGPSSCL